jgi:HEAT repeat protein
MKLKYRKLSMLDSNKLIAIFRRKGMKQKRAEACWLLGKRTEPRAIPALLHALKDNATEVQWEAAKALAAISHSDSIRPLIQLLRHGKTTNIRQVAAYALSFMFSKHSKEAAQALLSVLTDKKEKTVVRAQAAEGLGNMRHRPAFKALMLALHEKNTEVRFWSAFAVGQLGDPRALPKLREMVRHDPGVLSGWGSIKKEARDAIRAINRKYL